MNRKLLQQCLTKFEHLWEIGIDAEYKVDLMPEIRALRVELAKPEQAKYSDIVSDGGLDPRNKFDAQPEQEPVGWFLKDHLETYMESYKDIEGAIPLYTSPPRKEWVGLTDKEIADFSNWLSCMNLVKAVEAKLKEKNVG
jgi:hypothetical protein